jgi:hypothetical protein
MTGWQASQYDPGQQPGSPAPQAAGQQPTQQYGQPQPQYGQVQPYQAAAYPAPQPGAYAGPRPVTGLTAWQQFWYVLQCIYFGAGYFAKIPAKKALSDFGMVEMTGAEKFWYVLQCLAFGAGYFAKLPTAKALSEMPQFRAGAYR